MGFYNAGLSPSDFTIVRQLQPEIIGTLRNAAAKVGKGLGQPECIKWFGDDSDLWSAEVQEKLNLLAGMVNVKQIAVSFSRMDGRCGKELAEAMLSIAGLPAAVVGTNPMTTGENRNFRILLNHASWNSAPLYRPFKRPAASKFQILIHECTHLFLDTDDEAYGLQPCEVVVANAPAAAKINADTWGYFIEEFRL